MDVLLVRFQNIASEILNIELQDKGNLYFLDLSLGTSQREIDFYFVVRGVPALVKSY